MHMNLKTKMNSINNFEEDDKSPYPHSWIGFNIRLKGSESNGKRNKDKNKR
jgi:hypothetical protein